MSHRTGRADWALVVVLAVAAIHGAAGAAQQDVPEEMVLALVKNMYQPIGTPEPTILVGAMPDELAARMWLPEGTDIYGSIVQGGSTMRVGGVSFPQEASTTVIAGVDLPVEEVKSQLRAGMPSLGWRLSDTFERVGPQTQGAAIIPLLFCNEANDSVFVLADARGADRGRTLLSISAGSDSEGNPCRPRPETLSPQRPSGDVPRGPERIRMHGRLGLGDLVPPPSSFMASGRCPTGAAGSSAMAISTELSVAEIIGHYAAQLEEAGWERNEPSGPPPSASAGWKRTLDGESYEAVLLVAQHPGRPDCFAMELVTTFDGAPR